MRAALVEHFRDEAAILIATEAAAEGINLQFCNLVVNYDLPWNPQRIEQRIGRCHRYGQKCDVVVVNFLNKKNAADRRVYELLDQKFRLFSGIFGASDEVLGAVESGVDFEQRIAGIVQRCRTPEQIQFEFDQLQRELEEEISQGQREARDKLLDNFDQEVIEKVKVRSEEVLDRFTERLWGLTEYLLRDHAVFDKDAHRFMLHDNPFPGEAIHPGPYRMGRVADDANTYRAGHPLAQRVLALGRELDTPPAAITLDYRAAGRKISVMETLVGTSGWLACVRLSVEGIETEDALLLAGLTDEGAVLGDDVCRRFLELPGKVGGAVGPPAEIAAELTAATVRQEENLLQALAQRNGRWFDQEMDKLDRWAEDRRVTLKADLDSLDQALKAARKAAREGGTMPEKLARQREVRALEGKRDVAWRSYDSASQELERHKDALLEETARRLEQTVAREAIFVVRWEVAW